MGTGLRHAFERGFTHVVQVDADGRRDLLQLRALIEAALAQPGALITGRPVFDASAPRSRLISRWLTHVLGVGGVPLTRIRDSMCGFRVYPLAATLAVLDSEAVGRRMDFDPEIMVRLFWRGVPVVHVPVEVAYPEGNKSNFRMFQDNVLITLMHTRLVFTMLLRLPSILRNRPPQTEEPPRRWAAIGERGAYFGIKLLSLTHALLGRRGCLALMWPVVAYFHLTGGNAGSLPRLSPARPCPQGTAAAHLVGQPAPLHELCDQGPGYIHRLVRSGALRTGRGERRRGARPPLSRGKGSFVIVSHLGNSELSRARLFGRFRKSINVLAYTRHAALYNRIIRAVRPNVEDLLIQVTDVGPATAIDLRERIEHGEWIAIAGRPHASHG